MEHGGKATEGLLRQLGYHQGGRPASESDF
jgi:hypothetical protein